MTLSKANPYLPREAGRLATTCWCEAETLNIPKGLVGVSTVSCGRAECVPPVTTKPFNAMGGDPS